MKAKGFQSKYVIGLGPLIIFGIVWASWATWQHYDQKRGHEQVDRLFNDLLIVINDGLTELWKVQDDIEKSTKMIEDFNIKMEGFIKRKLQIQDRYPSFRRSDPEFFAQHQALFDEVIQAYFRLLRAGISINQKNPDDKDFKAAAYRGKYLMEAIMSDKADLEENGLLRKLGITP